MNNKVFVIMINYNAYNETLACVASLRQQTYNDLSIVIVDNFSTNESVQIIEKNCQDCILVKSSINLGFSGGNNLGAQKAIELGADYMIFLNNDTELEPDCIDLMIAGIRENECVCPQILYHSDREIINFRGGYFSKYLGLLITEYLNRLKRANY